MSVEQTTNYDTRAKLKTNIESMRERGEQCSGFLSLGKDCLSIKPFLFQMINECIYTHSYMHT